MSAIAGVPTDSRIASAMQAATGTAILSTEPLAEATVDQYMSRYVQTIVCRVDGERSIYDHDVLRVKDWEIKRLLFGLELVECCLSHALESIITIPAKCVWWINIILTCFLFSSC
jgi:hypothetical protein